MPDERLQVRRAFRRRLSRGARCLLRLRYGFDAWHCIPYEAKYYAAAVVELARALPEPRRGRVLDLGCGLGDLLRRLPFTERLGWDPDPRVIAAASLLGIWGDHAGTGDLSFHTRNLDVDLPPGRFDLVLALNWLHDLPPAEAEALVRRICDQHLAPHGLLCLDVVEAPGYPYHHRPAALLAGQDLPWYTLGPFANERRLVFIGTGTTAS